MYILLRGNLEENLGLRNHPGLKLSRSLFIFANVSRG